MRIFFIHSHSLHHKRNKVLWAYFCLFCLLPFLINSRVVKEPANASKIDNESKFPVESNFPLPPKTKHKKRLGYRNYSYYSSFGGSGLGEGFFDSPVAITVDNHNNIYVVDQGNNLIQKFDRNGEFLDQWGKNGLNPGEFDSPSAIAIDEYNNVWVVDTNNNRIQKFIFDENEQAKVLEIIVLGSLGSGEGCFQNPIDIVIDNKNDIYILDAGNNRIQKFNNSGKFKKEWGSYGSCRECFLAPTKLAYDPTGFGYLYALDQQREGFVLHKIDMNGRFQKTIDVFHNEDCSIKRPIDIFIDTDGFLYILDQATGCVCKFNTDGEFIQKIGVDPLSPKDITLKKPQAIVEDSDNRLLIIDSADNLIKIFDQI